MATGFEALGAASAVLQLISFAGSLVSFSFKIYDGIPTPENELQEYATKMLDASQRVQSRSAQVPRGTPVSDQLSEVAQKCIDAAEKLKTETETITKRYQKGKVFRAAHTAFLANKQRSKIKELDKSLKMCKEAMETELLLKICDKNAAIELQQSQSFRNLDSDLQSLISQLARGHTRIENLVTSEAKITRDDINTHLSSEFKALGAKTISDNQRERLLKSLKSEEIRQRYNDVLPSSDACFERVFASYELVCRRDSERKAWNQIDHSFDDETNRKTWEEKVGEIDQIWEGFSSWLQSNDNLFWIRGKPGSGKSTLIKFIINNDNTKCLLDSWNPNTRVLSHFFWKIGTEPQNSIKGLLCSLLHDLLSGNNDAIDQVFREFKFSLSKDFYKEWSSQEAEKILLSLLRADTRSTCIFIDGLDEISNKDGFLALVNFLQKLKSCQRVKVCVSSRPETELVNRLETLQAQNLRLEDLTKPEMAIYVLREFHKFSREQTSALPIAYLIVTLLRKSEGVFLWLVLATKSITNGIINGDDEKILSQRLEELPEELEALYESMWARLNGNNRIYRETAARYFRYVIADGWDLTLLEPNEPGYITSFDPTLAQLSVAVKVEEHLMFPPKVNEKSLSELKALCDTTEGDIQTRCAGMLQVGQHSAFRHMKGLHKICPFTRPVNFIHRSAYDFLVDTEAGQSILNYKSSETTWIDIAVKVFKSRLYLANAFYGIGTRVDMSQAPITCFRLQGKGVDPDITLGMLTVMKDLYEKGAI
ncbi:hypothetical protein ACJZ2D_017084 [Fusarium nematophilum]